MCRIIVLQEEGWFQRQKPVFHKYIELLAQLGLAASCLGRHRRRFRWEVANIRCATNILLKPLLMYPPCHSALYFSLLNRLVPCFKSCPRAPSAPPIIPFPPPPGHDEALITFFFFCAHRLAVGVKWGGLSDSERHRLLRAAPLPEAAKLGNGLQARAAWSKCTALRSAQRANAAGRPCPSFK